MTENLCLCGCGKALKGKQTKFSTESCRRRYKYYKHRKKELEFCLCGCGKPLKGKQIQFASKLCCKRYWAQRKKREFCLCGCGKRLVGLQRKYASNACLKRWKRAHLETVEKYQKKQELIKALAVADLVFDFELENSSSAEWSQEIKKSKQVLNEFRDEVKNRFGVGIFNQQN